jgi:hypothetical protein
MKLGFNQKSLIITKNQKIPKLMKEGNQEVIGLRKVMTTTLA